jgi:hypothetical protein
MLIDMTADEIDWATPFQIKVLKLHKVYATELLKTEGKANIQHIDLLNALIDEAISDNIIWETKQSGEIAPFVFLLDPYLKSAVGQDKIKNPFLIYTLSRLVKSEKFKTDIKLQKETFYWLVRFLGEKNYESHYRDILRFIFFRFRNKNAWEQDLKRFVAENLTRRSNDAHPQPDRYPLLYWFFDWMPGEKALLARGLKASVLKKVNDFEKNKLFTWLLLLILVDNDDQDAINRLTKIVKSIDNSQEGIAKATYMLPYLSLLRRNDIVELLANFLNDDKIIDYGDDISIRYVGLSSLASSALFTMITDFPRFRLRKFTQEERKNLKDWISSKKHYDFKPFDYWQDDPITSRVRYMIFEAE